MAEHAVPTAGALTLHKKMGAAVEVSPGIVLEDTESFVVDVGEPFVIDELSDHQKAELADPNSRLSSMVARISPMEAQARREARMETGADETTVTGGGPGEVTLTQVKKAEEPPAIKPDSTLTDVKVSDTGTEVTRSLRDREHLSSPGLEALRHGGEA